MELHIGDVYLVIASILGAFGYAMSGLVLGGIARVSQTQLLQPFMSILASILLLNEKIDLTTYVFAIAVVDAFTDTKFKGNPAGVCIIPKGVRVDGQWMQDLAEEMNLPETAFAQETDSSNYTLKWTYAVKDQEITFDSLSGELQVSNSGSLISLDFPTEHVSECKEANWSGDGLRV
ncbi:putative isomerase [Nymphon striatum]|nr:putative isomerase [Nymphon striatum]